MVEIQSVGHHTQLSTNTRISESKKGGITDESHLSLNQNLVVEVFVSGLRSFWCGVRRGGEQGSLSSASPCTLTDVIIFPLNFERQGFLKLTLWGLFGFFFLLGSFLTGSCCDFLKIILFLIMTVSYQL